MVCVVVILFLGYYLLMVFLLSGWNKATRNASGPSAMEGTTPFISVVVPFRNEKNSITNLLEDLSQLNYPSEKFQVVLVNDHTDDGSERQVEDWMTNHPRNAFKLLQLPANLSGKKAALTEGISQAAGEIIVTTDADCRIDPGWLRAVAGAFGPEVQMVSGPVRLGGDTSFFGSLQSMEFTSLIGVGAATLGWGIPTMSNGANLAIRTRIFDEVRGYEGNFQVASGDDEFLLRKVFSTYPDGVRFNPLPKSVVEAKSVNTVREFFHQRIRWAGKWRFHRFGFSTFLALFIFLFHCGVVSIPFLLISNRMSLQDASLLLGGKLLFEAVFLYRVSRFLKTSFSVPSFLCLQLVYSLYVLFFGLFATMFKATWKGREI